jgi:hypothetical protein
MLCSPAEFMKFATKCTTYYHVLVTTQGVLIGNLFIEKL